MGNGLHFVCQNKWKPFWGWKGARAGRTKEEMGHGASLPLVGCVEGRNTIALRIKTSRTRSQLFIFAFFFKFIMFLATLSFSRISRVLR